jgi:CheY-like chemotaxis protein
MEKLKLLVVEDNPDDFELFGFALRKSKVLCTAARAATSQEAIAYLDGWGKYSDRLDYPFPDVLILDLKMIGMDGFQVLKHVRSNPVYHLLPVIMFTNSSLDQDIQKAFELGANSYFVKPAALSDMNTLLEVLLSYWAWCRKPQMASHPGDAKTTLLEQALAD